MDSGSVEWLRHYVTELLPSGFLSCDYPISQSQVAVSWWPAQCFPGGPERSLFLIRVVFPIPCGRQQLLLVFRFSRCVSAAGFPRTGHSGGSQATSTSSRFFLSTRGGGRKSQLCHSDSLVCILKSHEPFLALLFFTRTQAESGSSAASW